MPGAVCSPLYLERIPLVSGISPDSERHPSPAHSRETLILCMYQLRICPGTGSGSGGSHGVFWCFKSQSTMLRSFPSLAVLCALAGFASPGYLIVGFCQNTFIPGNILECRNASEYLYSKRNSRITCQGQPSLAVWAIHCDGAVRKFFFPGDRRYKTSGRELCLRVDAPGPS